ncbi:MAG: alanine racemase [Planctomycetota bacterium]|jgi:alanine racemase|nr:alanine racemase [Planctomycetota bacterium]
MTTIQKPFSGEDPSARVWAEIDLSVIRRNCGILKKIVGPGVELLVVVKANAYGHGAVPVARAVHTAGASMVGVGSSTEALELIESGVRVPMLILGAVVRSELERIVDAGVAICLHSTERARVLSAVAARRGRTVPVHLMVDTGMTRLGVLPAAVGRFLDEISRTPHVRLVGLATHFSHASGKGGEEHTRTQMARFAEVREFCQRAGFPIRYAHAAASAGLVRYPDSRGNLVRPGILTYGLDPGETYPQRLGIEPALSLKAQVIYLKDVEAGTPVGYGGQYLTQEATRLATIPIGYADGYQLSYSNCAHVLVRGERAPVVGRVCMDYTIVDVGHIAGVRVGDIVTLIGKDGDEWIRAEELARHAGTIPYEVTCCLGRRVERIYHPSPETYPLAPVPVGAGGW